MNSTDVIAYATPDGDLLCAACACSSVWDNDAACTAVAGTLTHPLEAVDETGRRFYEPAFAGAEADAIPCCDHCGWEIDGYQLTAEGRRDLARSLMGRKVRRLFDDDRPGGGKGESLPYRDWYGGDELIYLTKDGGVLCPECVNKWLEEPDRWDAEQMAPQDYDVYWEGPTIQCDHCYADIESAYGDPEEEEEEEEAAE